MVAENFKRSSNISIVSIIILSVISLSFISRLFLVLITSLNTIKAKNNHEMKERIMTEGIIMIEQIREL